MIADERRATAEQARRDAEAGVVHEWLDYAFDGEFDDALPELGERVSFALLLECVQGYAASGGFDGEDDHMRVPRRPIVTDVLTERLGAPKRMAAGLFYTWDEVAR